MLHSIPDQALLTIWEQGWSQPPVWRALLLLAGALPDASTDELAALPIGRRDRHLLALRERLFGPNLPGVAACPACTEQLEFSFSVADVMVVDETAATELNSRGYRLRLRPPNSQDLLAVARLDDPTEAEQQLLARCIVEATRQGKTAHANRLPAAVRQAVEAQLAAIDPQANVTINLNCPACRHEWSLLFDILSYLWQELDTWAWRTLYEVHQLAAAYGWREADSLALSPWRRRQYLEMAYG
ncbi:MAG: phage baseplate protein [Chloroflexota bacterium]